MAMRLYLKALWHEVPPAPLVWVAWTAAAVVFAVFGEWFLAGVYGGASLVSAWFGVRFAPKALRSYRHDRDGRVHDAFQPTLPRTLVIFTTPSSPTHGVEVWDQRRLFPDLEAGSLLSEAIEEAVRGVS